MRDAKSILDDMEKTMERSADGLIIGHGYWEYNACYGFGAVPGPCCEFGCYEPMEEHARWRNE